MTQLSDQAIEEYQDIYFKEYGERISKEQARVQGTKLVNLFRIIYKPISSDISKQQASMCSDDECR